MFKAIVRIPTILLTLLLFACDLAYDPSSTESVMTSKLTPLDAVEFVARSGEELADLLIENEQMAWVYSNFITQDTEMLAALANKKFTARQVELAVEAAGY